MWRTTFVFSTANIIFFEHQCNQLIVELTMYQEMYYATKLERLINIFASGK